MQRQKQYHNGPIHSARTFDFPLQPTQSPEGQLTPLEEKYIGPLRDGSYMLGFIQLQACRTDGRRLHGNLFRRFGPSLASKPLRFGCILYSMYKNGEATTDNPVHLVYLDRFYTAMREAIQQRAFPDLVYASFTAVLYSLKLRHPFAEIVGHVKAFRLSAPQMIRSSGTVDEETFLIECMWEKLIWHMCRLLVFNSRPPVEWLHQLMDFAKPLSLSDFRFSPWIHGAFGDIQVKFQFLRFILSLERERTIEGTTFKKLIISSFLRTWISTFPNTQLREVARNLWSNLFDLLSLLQHRSTITPNGKAAEIIHSIQSIIPRIDPHSSGTLFEPMILAAVTMQALSVEGMIHDGLHDISRLRPFHNSS